MKRIAIGRKNWLFIRNPSAGIRNASLMSLVASALRMEHDVSMYLESIITHQLGGQRSLRSYSLIAGGRIIQTLSESIGSKSGATKRTLPVFKPPSGELAVSCARRSRILGTYLATPKSTLFLERRCTLSM
jgi:hypothetical protein